MPALNFIHSYARRFARILFDFAQPRTAISQHYSQSAKQFIEKCNRCPIDVHLSFLKFVSLYVVLLSLSAVLEAGLFRVLSYAAALIMLFALTVKSFGKKNSTVSEMAFMLPLLLYYYGLIASIGFNYKMADWSVAIKFSLAPLFLLIGSRIEAQNCAVPEKSNFLPWFGLVALLPIMVLGLQLAKGMNVFSLSNDFSIFANRNNAGLYAVALLGLYTVHARTPPTNVLIYLAVSASFGTLGVLVATIFSLMLNTVNQKNLFTFTIGLVAISFALVLLAINEISIFARFKPAFGTLELLLDPKVNLPAMSYERLYYALGTTDLSLAFRIKHWHDLVNLFGTSGLFGWFFGLGIGSSVKLSQATMVPHNDYLRILFECGFVTFVGFVSMIAVMLVRFGRRWETIPFMTIAFYMFSENLIDNFLAISVFYYSGGVLLQRIASTRKTAPRTPCPM